MTDTQKRAWPAEQPMVAEAVSKTDASNNQPGTLDWLGPISTALADRHLGMHAHQGYDLHMLPTVLHHTGRICHSIARLHGWWDRPEQPGVYDPSCRNPFELIGLMHTELSELFERMRDPAKFVPDKHCPQFDNAEIEAADLLIRLLDMAQAKGWRLGAATIAKIAANERRPHRHGGKLA